MHFQAHEFSFVKHDTHGPYCILIDDTIRIRNDNDPYDEIPHCPFLHSTERMEGRYPHSLDGTWRLLVWILGDGDGV